MVYDHDDPFSIQDYAVSVRNYDLNSNGLILYVCHDDYCNYKVSVGILLGNENNLEQELLTFPEHLSAPPVFSGVRVNRSLVLCVCFVDRWLFFCPFFFWTLCCLSFDFRILITPLIS